MTNVARRTYGLQQGAVNLQSIGPITFGPESILFIADSSAATIFAVDTEPWTDAAAQSEPIAIEHLDQRLAAYLGCARDDVRIRDMAVRPGSQQIFLSVMRGTGNSGLPLLLTLGPNCAINEIRLQDVRFSTVAIDDAPAVDDQRLDVRLAEDGEPAEDLDVHGTHLRIARDPLRTVTVTDMAYGDGILLVAGASNEEFSSTLRRIPFPFEGTPARTHSRSSTSHMAGMRPLRHSARLSSMAATRASWRVTRARQLCTSRSQTWNRAAWPKARPWPIWAL